MTMTDDSPKTGKELTGKHVLLITVSFFAVVIAVNVFMAAKAIQTFPGLEVKSPYVANQTFDVERDAQAALGWEVRPTLAGETLMLMITDAYGNPANAREVTAILGRATHVQDDQTLTFTRSASGAMVAPIKALDFGKWELRLSAVAGDGTKYRKLIELYVPKES